MLDMTLYNESILQLSDICGDRDVCRDRLAEYEVTHEVTTRPICFWLWFITQWGFRSLKTLLVFSYCIRSKFWSTWTVVQIWYKPGNGEYNQIMACLPASKRTLTHSSQQQDCIKEGRVACFSILTLGAFFLARLHLQ